MKADQHTTMADIGGDPHMDIAIPGDTVDGKLTVKPGVLSTLCETRSQAKRLRMSESFLFHTESP